MRLIDSGARGSRVKAHLNARFAPIVHDFGTAAKVGFGDTGFDLSAY